MRGKSVLRGIAAVVIVGLVVSGAPAVAAPPAPPAPLLGSAAQAGDGRYIVVLKSAASLAAATAKARRPGGRVTHEYRHALDGFAAQLSPQALDEVRRDPSVAYVEADGKARADGVQTDPPSWGLDRIDAIRGQDQRYRYSATGEGVTVYVVDSGVRISHNEFRGRARNGWDFVDGDGVAQDCDGHGTHVAGTIGGAQVGVAKEATIVAVRVLDCDGEGDVSDMVAALDWAVGNAGGRRAVLNMSISANYPSSSLDNAVRRAVAAGITVVLSAGNDGENACDHSPARVPEALTVGSTNNADTRAASSNWGSCLDIFAPGDSITSAGPNNDGERRVLSGTSMAAPHVAGIAAHILQANSAATPDQVRTTLLNGSVAGVVNDARDGSPNRLARRPERAYQIGPNAALNNLFNNYGDRNLGYWGQCADWSGGDGTQSIQLPSGKRAWFFSDSFLGDPRLRTNGFDTSMIRNSVIVQSGGSLRTITGGGTCLERRTDIDFLSRYARTPVDTPGGNEFYWTADGAVVGGNVVKFHYRNVPTPDGWWQETNTAIEVTPVSAYENNPVINVSPRIIPAHHPYANHPILWGLALLDVDPYYYVYGSAAINDRKQRRLYLARVPKGQLADFGSWYFHTGNNTWSPHQSQAVPVHGTFEPTMAYSVARLNGAYWLIQKTPTIDDGSIVAHPADTPWGFTDRRVTLHTPPVGTRGPGNTWQWWYDARLHLGVSGDPTKAVISYNQNSTAVTIGCRNLIEHDGRVYRPRFITISTSAFDPDAATASLATAAGSPTPDRRGARLRTAPPGSGRSAATAGGDFAAMADNNWYDAWAHIGGCPPLTNATTASGTTGPDGRAILSWSHYGPDMWYWIERRDATAGGAWQRMELWRTTTDHVDLPVTSPALNGHTFEYRVVPFASGFGGREAPASAPVRLAMTVDRPAAPASVTASSVDGAPGTVEVRWAGVSYPSERNYYSVYHWNISKGQTRENAASIRFIGQLERSVRVGDLVPGDLYGFVVIADNVAGQGPPSGVVTAVA